MKKRFLAAIEKEDNEQQEQEKLRVKHNIQDKEVVVVEKSNMLKFSVNSITTLVRVIANILILVLASIGLLCMVYTETREPLLEILEQMKIQLIQII